MCTVLIVKSGNFLESQDFIVVNEIEFTKLRTRRFLFSTDTYLRQVIDTGQG